MKLLTVVLISTLACAQTLPPKSSPGALNPAVTQATIATTICVKGWTKTVRPPASYTTALKKKQMAALHLPGTTRSYEEDHRVPLELGGDPRSAKNLWPETWAHPYGAHEKDRLENAVKLDVCDAQPALTLQQARAIFLGNFWIEYKLRFEQ